MRREEHGQRVLGRHGASDVADVPDPPDGCRSVGRCRGDDRAELELATLRARGALELAAIRASLLADIFGGN